MLVVGHTLELFLVPTQDQAHRVDYDDVDGIGAHQHVADFQRLFPGIRLGDQQIIHLDPQLAGIYGIQGVSYNFV